MNGHTVFLDGRNLTIFDVVHIARDGYRAELTPDAWSQVARGRSQVEQVLREGGRAYGVNTGVGSQKDSDVAAEDIATFNRRLIVAHATVASSMTLTPVATRAAMVVLLNQLASGWSGVRTQLVHALQTEIRRGGSPTVSAGASVGASDLVPLAQMALSLIGAASPLEPGGPRMPKVDLAPKEALSLINSNAISLGSGCLALLEARKLVRGFDLSLAMSLEGFRGNPSIVHISVEMARPQPGQQTSARHVRRLLRQSKLNRPEAPRLLQDPLSFRCAPQVNGCAYSALEWAWKNWEVELNSVQDNPAVDVEDARLIAHGNMDSSLLTLSLDSLRLALANVVDISAQRLHKLHWPAFSGLAAGLATHESALGGVQFLNLGHIAEAYAAQVRAYARPTMLNYQGQLADGVEDHASQLPLAVAETDKLLDVAWGVQALELIVACWAMSRRQLDVSTLGEGVREVYKTIHPMLPMGREGTEVFDLRSIVELVRHGDLVDLIDEVAPPVPEFEPAPEESVVST